MSALVVKHSRVAVRPWISHTFDILKSLVGAMTYAMLKVAKPITTRETRHLRWVQNPIFSGGLASHDVLPESTSPHNKFDEAHNIFDASSNPTRFDDTVNEDLAMTLDEAASTPTPTTGRGHTPSMRDFFTQTRNTRLESVSAAEQLQSDELLLSLCEVDRKDYARLFFDHMRRPANRVALDQGRDTHHAAASLGAALIRVNGLDAEAVSFANEAMENGFALAPPRLKKVWGAAQHVRLWINDLVVNGDAESHLEACGVVIDRSSQDPNRREDVVYQWVGALVAQRCRFLIAQVRAPALKLRTVNMARRDAAIARWHRLKLHFAPKTHEAMANKYNWGVVLGGTKALRRLGEFYGLPSPQNPSRSSSRSPKNSNLKRRVSSHSLLHRSMSMHQTKFSLEGRGDNDSTTSTLRRMSVTSWGSIMSSTNETSANMGVRRERTGGGLRRASMSNVLEGGGVPSSTDVDIAFLEYKQSMTNSVLKFAQTPTEIELGDLRGALQDRNTRAR